MRAAGAAPGLLAALLLLACDARPVETPDGAVRRDPGLEPTPPRAVLLASHDEVGVGEPFEMLLLVETAPTQQVEPPPAPRLDGVTLLGVESELQARPGPRLLHTTRHRLRATAPGTLLWPSSEVLVETAGGESRRLPLPERRIEIVSVRARFARDQPPFGLRELPGRPTHAGFVAGLIAGVVATTALGLALGALRRRRRTRGAGSATPSPAAPAAEEPASEPGGDAWLRAELARAQRLAAADPRAAANAGAAALRAHAARRFRIRIESATSEELASLRPGAAAEAVWSEFLRILRGYDAERFAPRDGDAQWSRRVAQLLCESERFLVGASRPGDPQR